MGHFKFGVGFTVFVLFFGIALLEAVGERNWWRMLFWIVMGFVFFLADNNPASGTAEEEGL